MVVRLALLSTLLLVGCAKGTVDGFDSFNSGNESPGSGADDPSAMTTEGSATGNDSLISESFTSSGTSTATTQTASGSSDSAPTTGVSAEDSSSTGASVTLSGSDTTTGGGEESSSSGGATGSQPAMGMYAHCIEDMYDNCDVTAPICIFIPTPDGICTQDGCVNPAVDCDPSPGGNAVPFCWTGLDALGAQIQLCGLNCNVAGAVCPTGMTCVENVAFPGQPSYDLCL